MRAIIMAAAAALALGGVARAEDYVGPYAGVFMSIGGGNFDVQSSGTATFPLNSYSNPLHHLDGYVYGLKGGYNWRSGSLGFGAEGNFSFSSLGTIYKNITRSTPTDFTLLANVRDIADVRGRVGYVTDRTFFYALGGAATARATIEARGASPVTADTVKQTHTGAVYGVGVAQKVKDRVSLFAEYNRFDFGSEPYNYPSTTKFGDNQIKLETSRASMGLVVSFP